MGGRCIGTRNLNKIFDPRTIAVIGASSEEGSIGNILMNNLIGVGFKGVVYPVTTRFDSINGVHSYGHIFEVPRMVDLALVHIDEKEGLDVKEVLTECAEAGVSGAIVYSEEMRSHPAFQVSRTELDELVENLNKEYGMRVLGPNTFGFMRPTNGLNAGIYQIMPQPGNVAFISQSNAIFPALLDWAAYKGVGFSALVSVGSMVGISIADLIDFFGMDMKTRSIMIYMEALCQFKEFMSAARQCAKTKPIIVVKSAKHEESAIAAESHTGTLTTNDDLYEAAFRRAGILRVKEIQEIFNCSHALAKQPRPKGGSFAILTNAGGPAIMCADEIIDTGGRLATLKGSTIHELEGMIPGHWSRANPITIGRRVKADVYRKVLARLFQEPEIDGIAVVFTGTSKEQSTTVAQAMVEVDRNIVHKPLLAAWMGKETLDAGRQILEDGGIPTFNLPEKAADTLTYMYQYERNLQDLYETPEDILHGFEPKREIVKSIFEDVVGDGRSQMTEHEAHLVLRAYGIPTVESRLVQSLDECLDAVKEFGFPVVLKVVSPQILHKSDVGGVHLNIRTEEAVRTAYELIRSNVNKVRPDATINGILVQPMVTGQGYEVIVGLKWDPCFGPALLFGAGGIMVELIRDRSLGFPPLNQVLAKRLIDDTQMGRVLKGLSGRPPADRRALEEAIVKVSYLAIDFPEIREMDINPIYIDDACLIALDSTMVIDPEQVKGTHVQGRNLIISLYPTRYNTTWRIKDGQEIFVRAIRPEDEPMWTEFLESLSQESIRNRFFAPVTEFGKEMSVRYCHIDYEREMAIITSVKEDGKERMMGVGRLIINKDESKAEFAIVIGDDFQGKGIGCRLLEVLVQIGKDRGLDIIWGDVLAENEPMLRLCSKLGFTIHGSTDGEIMHLTLEL